MNVGLYLPSISHDSPFASKQLLWAVASSSPWSWQSSSSQWHTTECTFTQQNCFQLWSGKWTIDDQNDPKGPLRCSFRPFSLGLGIANTLSSVHTRGSMSAHVSYNRIHRPQSLFVPLRACVLKTTTYTTIKSDNSRTCSTLRNVGIGICLTAENLGSFCSSYVVYTVSSETSRKYCPVNVVLRLHFWPRDWLVEEFSRYIFTGPGPPSAAIWNHGYQCTDRCCGVHDWARDFQQTNRGSPGAGQVLSDCWRKWGRRPSWNSSRGDRPQVLICQLSWSDWKFQEFTSLSFQLRSGNPVVCSRLSDGVKEENSRGRRGDWGGSAGDWGRGKGRSSPSFPPPQSPALVSPGSLFIAALFFSLSLSESLE